MDKEKIKKFILLALKEDVGDSDHSTKSCIPAGKKGKAEIIAKENGIIAGVELAEIIFKTLDSECKLNFNKKDGDKIFKNDIILRIDSKIHILLKTERLVLNCMQRMSGIATFTRKLADKIKNTPVKILDTRKTTPTLRWMEKWAVKIGGGINHRNGLYDMIMIKNNHITYAGGVEKAIQKANEYLLKKGKNLPIEIEVSDLEQLGQVMTNGNVNRIMLDNMSFKDMREAVKIINGKYETEASGNINLQTILKTAKCGVDFISIGALTHSFKSLDLCMRAVLN